MSQDKTIRQVMTRLEEELTSGLQTKTGWGRNEVLALFKSAQVKALCDVMDQQKTVKAVSSESEDDGSGGLPW